MFKFFQRYREPLIVGALLVAPLISFLSHGGKGREPNFIDGLVQWLSTPIEGGLSWTLSGLGNGIDGYVALRGAHQEAAECRMELAEAHADLNELREAEAENRRMKAMLGYVEGTIDQEVLARVVGVNPNPHFQSLRINRGENDGVRVGMPVVTPEGVVGQVVRTVGSSADVMLLTDPASRIGALDDRTRVRVTVNGSGDGKQLALEYARREDDVREGDLVVTSGTDGVFPRGLKLGLVKEVQRPLVGMFLSGRVVPSVDLLRVEEVLVVPTVPAVSQAPRGPQ